MCLTTIDHRKFAKQPSYYIRCLQCQSNELGAALQSVKLKEKIAILGQMNELGKQTDTEHKQLVEWVQASLIDDCYWVGAAFESFVSADKYFSNTDQAMAFFSSNPIGDGSLLVKRVWKFYT